MILRAALSLFLSLTALGVGVYTAFLASQNRAEGARLDASERWCETVQRQNALLREDVEHREFLLLHPDARAEDAAQDAGDQAE